MRDSLIVSVIDLGGPVYGCTDRNGIGRYARPRTAHRTEDATEALRAVLAASGVASPNARHPSDWNYRPLSGPLDNPNEPSIWEYNMNRPATTDPLEHALYNDMIARLQVRIVDIARSYLDTPIPYVLSEDFEEPKLTDLLPVKDLLAAVRRVADQLEGQGARSDRLALQLLTAIATFEKVAG